MTPKTRKIKIKKYNLFDILVIYIEPF